ncbi:WYL domain-containing protein [Desulfopila sp. IMCC35008]|uniref:WYL domain-containing protein n=1 Tax=Desulfopila sp. IMCC35008 TaxID=2653858 RepID=UPI0013D5E146|nr:WYL domain-containing protein [Desulfopila sp. IMCC35008]
MKWNVRKRLEFIESRLAWEEKISRGDLIDYFDISTPQSTKDLKLYQEKAPSNLYYDKRMKQYIAAEGFDPFFVSFNSQSYLSRLLIALRDKTKGVFSCGKIPPAYQLPNLERMIETPILKAILSCLHSHHSIMIEYQSMNSPKPAKRWISPHALGFAEHRWHVRSLCHNNKEYRDFNLGRILSVGDIRMESIDHSNDFLWHNSVSYRITTHPDLTPSQKKLIERDYNMVNGVAEVEVKAAFHFYFQKRLNLTKGHEKKPAKEQHIILTNEDEINTQIKLLRDIEKKRLAAITFAEETC